ncbi:MAG: fructose-1,6-bisphosphatase I [Gammaproteobacteria bacterium]|jgi:fructose-1,6-bisphosphatase I
MTQAASQHPFTESTNLTSLQSYLLAGERDSKGASGQFTWILSAISLSAKVISDRIRRARIESVLGALDSENVQGEVQQKLDVIANEVLLRCLGERAGVAIVASEENEEPIILRTSEDGERPYVVLFDPLDGSSNLDVCGGVGTIFGILRHDRRAQPVESSPLQPGMSQVAAGYVLFGSSTIFVLTTGDGVAMFVLDPSVGAFMLVDDNVRMPSACKTYSVNEAYRETFPSGYQDYLSWAHGNGYSSRYVGSMVADIHRTLIKGGVFFYPPTKSAPQGKLRLMYEANPMAMILEQAGGKAFADKQRILEIQPQALHQRTSVVMGSADEVDQVLKFL